jgi:hypothetical protein
LDEGKMDSYPNNSNYAKESKIHTDEPAVPEKKIEKVIEGEVIRRKKPWGKRISEALIGGDSRTVTTYILQDVLIPAVKDTIADAMSQGVERMLFGEARSTNRRSGRRGGGNYVSYNRPSYSSSRPPWDDRRDEPRALSRRARANHDFDEIILKTRAEATEVLERLFDLISSYKTATVADLYELLGIDGSYTDDKWGWDSLPNADVIRVPRGYLLRLPRPEPID